jgi:UDP-N-acetylglucosamine 4-epimerase
MNEVNKKINLLITGGAGFVGSNLVEHFLNDDRIGLVRVIDDLSNGYYENVEEFLDHPKYEFVEGSITDYELCEKVMKGIDKVSHQAALGSVPRSIDNPMKTNEVNVGGTVNILHAAMKADVERVVCAFSSSTYGDHPGMPKVEGNEGKPLSPYAVSKAAVEQYAEVFGKTYGLNWIGLRYFNIYGPRQNPDNPYAAVIPIFCKAFIEGNGITINGDGETSRDFTFVANAIQANERALFTENKHALNQVYNTACGDQVTLNEMVQMLREISGNEVPVHYGPERPGDVKHSRADISKIEYLLEYKPEVRFKEGLERVYRWYEGSNAAGAE